jgi:hypothetical protein
MLKGHGVSKGKCSRAAVGLRLSMPSSKQVRANAIVSKILEEDAERPTIDPRGELRARMVGEPTGLWARITLDHPQRVGPGTRQPGCLWLDMTLPRRRTHGMNRVATAFLPCGLGVSLPLRPSLKVSADL